MEEIKTVQIGQITLAYKEFGSGDKYLLSTQNFFLTDCHMELLGKPPYDYHCFLVYMRGYGKSTHITDNVERDYNEIWGEDLLAFAKAMGIKSFYYTGVSHGNFAGWYAAFNHPEVLKGFVCCDGIVQYRQPEKGGSPSSRRNPDADKVVGNYELLEKWHGWSHGLRKTPNVWRAGRPITRSILPSLWSAPKKNSKCRILEI